MSVKRLEDAEHFIVDRGDAEIEVAVLGDGGPTVVLLPSLGRAREDFDDLAGRLARNGFRVVLPQPRGIGKSQGPLEGLTLHDFGDDVAAAIRKVVDTPVAILGHAFGNRVARVVASDHSNLVTKVVLLACGGAVPAAPEAIETMYRSFDLSLPVEERMEAVRQAYFAPGNDPAVWEGGWHSQVARAQSKANRSTPVEEWWAAGNADILVVQALQDIIAVPENARLLAAEFANRVTVMEIDGAGHAMLPEKPLEIAEIVIDWLGS